MLGGAKSRGRILNAAALFALSALLALGPLACSDDAEPAADSTVAPKDGGTDGTGPDGGGVARELIILHTNDLHDQLLGRSPNADYTPGTTGDDSTLGGVARLMAKIKSERAAAKTAKVPVLLLDAGDFTMGTAFSWLNTSKAPMLSLMQQAGYDAITLGNHEFDWGHAPLAAILAAAKKEGFSVPIVASNTVFSTTSADDALEALKTSGMIRDKLVKTLDNGLKVGIIGLLGKTASGLSPLATPVTFSDMVTTTQKLVTELRGQDKVDLVVVISHSGINQAGDSGDDANLAQKVSGIDVIVSGHTHTTLSKPLVVNGTTIVQTGSYMRNLGKLSLSISGGKVTVKKGELLALDDTIKGDSATMTAVDGYISALDTMLQPLGLSYKKVVAETTFDLPFPAFKETGLGNMITDAYMQVAGQALSADPPVLAIEAGGVIRDPIYKGKTGQIWFGDALRALPLGAGPDGKPGYPLVSFYLTPKEIKAGMEVIDVAKTLGMEDYFLQISGGKVEFNTKANVFGRVSKVEIAGKALDLSDTTTCYPVVTNLYVGSMMASVASISAGVLKLEPKLKDCSTKVTDMGGQAIKVGGNELKQWQAMVQFMAGLPDSDGDKIPEIPAKYKAAEGRLVYK